MPSFKFGKKNKRKDIDSSMEEDSSFSQSHVDDDSYGSSSHPLPSSHPEQPFVSSSHSPIEQSFGQNHLDSKPSNVDVYSSSPWKRYRLKNSPFPRYRHAASNIASDKNDIYLMGGLKEGSVFGDTWKISPEVNGSEITGYTGENIMVINNNNPPARVGHSSVLVGNAFIIYGGDTVDTDFNGFPDNNFYLFNINNNKYTIPSHILNKPNGRYGHTIGVVSLNNQSSRLYLFGGQLENDVFNDLHYFELNTFKTPKARWELVEPMNNFTPPPLTNHSMSIYKNKLYVFGGVYNNEKVSNDLWCFDIVSSRWNQITTTGNLPLPVNEHSACITNDCLYIYGGNDFSGIIYNSLYVLNLHTLVWSKLIPNGEVNSPGARCGHSMSYIPSLNKLIVMGGDKNDYVSSDPNDFETYETREVDSTDTMIYQLDLDVIDAFLSSKQTVIKASKKALSAINPGLASTGLASSNTFVNDVPLVEEPAIVSGPSLRTNHFDERPGILNKQEYERHGRSFSAGPEDFRTPDASPERHTEPEPDRFVEVPSSTISERDVTTEDELDNYDRSEPVTTSVHPSGNGSSFPSRNNNRYIEERLDNNSTPKLSQTGDNEKVKKLINELNAELTELKRTTKSEMQNATERIHELEAENAELKASNANDLKREISDKDQIIRELKQQVDPSLLEIPEEDENHQIRGINGSISELTKFKLDRIELNNKLIYLTKENEEMKEKLNEFEPFMNNQIGELSNFQKIIKNQEEKISKLTQQVVDQEGLRKELNEWKHKYDDLELEHKNFKLIHEDSDEEEIEESNDNTNRSILSNSTKRGRKDISSHLESLVNIWSNNTRNTSIAANRSMDSTDAVDPMVLELQKQLDQLMRVSKEQEATSTREIANLKDSSSREIIELKDSASKQVAELKNELDQSLLNLKTLEDNYKEALQSVNNTSKALSLTQDELNNQKQTIDKLTKENKELKLFKKASKRTSSRNPLLAQPSLDNFGSSPHFTADNVASDNEENIEEAHFNMKLKDLEADLFILKQERDLLKDNVTSLQKQLYLAQNS